MSEHVHADLDALADVLAGERDGTDLASCATCSAALADLDTASSAVSSALAGLPAPALPVDLAERLDAALRAAVLDGVDPVGADTGPGPAQASVTTLPTRELPSSSPRRWLPAAAAAVVLLGGGGLAVSSLSGGTGADDASTASGEAADSALTDLVRNDTGSTYDPTSLVTAVPGLLSGKAATLPRSLAVPAPAAAGGAATGSSTGGTAAAPSDAVTETSGRSDYSTQALTSAAALDRLRTPEGLAECLVALLPPDDESVQPLALDYGSFVVDGVAQPALVVVLPVPRRADKVDVFVVGGGCAQADEQLLHFARVDRP